MRGGGILGLVTTTTADSGALSPDDADALRRNVERSGLLRLPDHLGGTTQQPDAFDYEITVDDGDRTSKVVLSEGALPEEVRSLISWITSVPGHRQSISPPGAA